MNPESTAQPHAVRNRRYSLVILGFICTLIAMRRCGLTKDEMVNVRKRITDKKAAAKEELDKEELHKEDTANA